MKPLFFLLCALTASVLSLPAETTPAANRLNSPKEAGETISVFFLIGQSNMVGAAYLHQIEGSLPPARPDIPYAYRLPPLPYREGHQLVDSGSFVPLDATFREGELRWGPELTLGTTLKDTILPDEKIALVKFARGGSNLYNDWRLFATEGERLHPRSIDYLREQLDALRALGYRPFLRGAFWFQGEGDSNKAEKYAGVYARNLKALIASYRDAFDAPKLPFIIARINPTKPQFIHAPIVRQAIVDVAEADPFVAWVDIDDLNFPDQLHVDGAGQFILGRRFAEAWANIALPAP